MKEFAIVIEETVVQEFKISAKNSEEALKIALQKYKKGELIVEDGESQAAQMAVVIPDKDLEWIEI